MERHDTLLDVRIKNWWKEGKYVSKYQSVDETVVWIKGLIRTLHRNEIRKYGKKKLSPSARRIERNWGTVTKLLGDKLEQRIGGGESVYLHSVVAETLSELSLPAYPAGNFSPFSEVRHDYFLGISYVESFPSKEYTVKAGKSHQIDGVKREQDLMWKEITKETPPPVGKINFSAKQSKRERVTNAIKSIKIR